MAAHDVTTPRGRRTTQHELSLGQEQIWLHSKLISDPLAYNEPFTLTHRGPLDVEALRRSLAVVIRRHEAWRTTFHEIDGRPVAVVHEPRPVELPVVDLRHLAPDARGPEAAHLATDDARRPFDIGVGPLVRFLLVMLSEDEQRLYVTLHQIIFDGVSMNSGFLPEVASIYADLAADREVSLPEPPAQYQDFVRWQRAATTDSGLADHLAYWREQLGESRSPLDLPTDRPRPAVQGYEGEQISFSLPEDLSRDLRSFSRQEGVTPFVTLLTVFAALLARRTGDEAPTIGTVTSLRKRAELEGLLGFYLSTLALRLDLGGDPSFRDAVRRTGGTVAEGLRHDEVPIHHVVRALEQPRDSSRNPLFQAMLVVEPPPPEPPAGWELSQLDLDVGRSRTDLYLEFADGPGALVGRIRYATALFRRATIEGILAQFQVLARAAIETPDRPIGALPILTDVDRRIWLSAHDRVAPGTPFEPFTAEEIEQSIAGRFARQVDRFGDRPAVVDADGTWSYRELDMASERVASALAPAVSATPDEARGVRIGILGRMDRPCVAGIFGILKAGAAYVPLDPDMPSARIRVIAEDAGLAMVVVTAGFGDLARTALDGTARLELAHVLDGAVGPDGGGNHPGEATADDPAYLLYTSGSTGEPKGTLQRQRNVLHHIRAYTNALHLSADDRVLIVAKPTFDASVMDLFGALLNGAALCVVDLHSVGFAGLRDAIVDQRVTVYHSTPTVYRELVASLGPADRLEGVRLVVLGGEEARASDLDAFRRHFARDAVFVNGFGPTESTLALQYLADASTTVDGISLPIGYPVEGTEAFLLDPYGRPTEFVGEIAIRSRYVAPGYWNRPDLTAAAFEPDPDDADLVTYRTGDIGRRLADGSLEFAGRRDRQIKIHGIRVEIAEIEGALAALPGVRQAAVEPRTIDSTVELVAYLEAPIADRRSNEAIRGVLREALPAYMIPSAIVWLDRLPRTSSNKIDRRALPPPSVEPQPAAVVGPRDKLEARLTRIWEDVLSRHPIGIDDDFFDLGGHSLLAVRLFDRIWRDLGQRIPTSALLEGATIERLAARIRDGHDEGPTGLIAVQPTGTRPPLFMVPGAGSRVLYLRNLAVHLGADQPLYALHQPPTGPTGHADRRVEDLAGHYITAIRRVQPTGPYHLVGFSFGGAVAYEIARQLTTAGEAVALLALIDSRNPIQPLPASGFHPRFVARRVTNQIRIVRRLGARLGARYLRTRLATAREQSIVGARDLLDRRLPARLRRLVWVDPIRDAERDWIAADGAAFDRYRPAPYPGRITFLWAEHNQRPPAVFDTRRGWAELALGGFDVVPVPGSHLTVLLEPLVAITAAKLAGVLREISGGAAVGPRAERSSARVTRGPSRTSARRR